MNKEKQNIAIALACGWTHLAEVNDEGDWHGQPPSAWSADGLYGTSPIPRYTEDLNAMHAAEKELSMGHLQDYVSILAGVGDNRPETYDHFIAIARATAAQRAEAFLRTMALWEDA